MSTIEETAKNLRREHMDAIPAPWLRTLRLAHDDAITLVNMRHAGLKVGRQTLQAAGVMSEWRHGLAHGLLRIAMVNWQAPATKLWAEESAGRVDAATARLLSKGAACVALLRAEAGAKYRAECGAVAAPQRPSPERNKISVATSVKSGERGRVEQRG